MSEEMVSSARLRAHRPWPHWAPQVAVRQQVAASVAVASVAAQEPAAHWVLPAAPDWMAPAAQSQARVPLGAIPAPVACLGVDSLGVGCLGVDDPAPPPRPPVAAPGLPIRPP